MPLKKGSSKETISKNIETEVKKFNKTGKIGTSKPESKKKAVKQAAAIAYAKAGKKKSDENSECAKPMKKKIKKLHEGSESEKADQDFDGDGKVESPEQEYKGSKDKAIKKAKGEAEDENSEETIKESFHTFVKSTLRKLFALE